MFEFYDRFAVEMQPLSPPCSLISEILLLLAISFLHFPAHARVNPLECHEQCAAAAKSHSLNQFLIIDFITFTNDGHIPCIEAAFNNP